MILLFIIGGIVLGQGLTIVCLMFAADAENHAEAFACAAEPEEAAA